MGKSLEILAKRSGAAVLGWLADDVFYVGLVGYVSSGLGSKAAARMLSKLEGSTIVHCFCNAHLSHNVDFMARSAIVRTMLTNRRRIASMTALVGTPASNVTAQAIDSVLDCGATILTDPNAFDELLVKTAPLAHLRLREIELTSLHGSARWRSSIEPRYA